MPTIMPNVSRSRFSWMNSLATMPSQRDHENQRIQRRSRGSPAPRAFVAASRIRWMNTSSRPALALPLPRPPGLRHQRRECRVETLAVGAGHVQCRAERGHLLARQAARAICRASAAVPCRSTDHVVSDWLAITSRRRALGQQLAVEDVAELVAALGLVHVMRADENGDAARGKRVQLLPEVAPRLRVDAGGRLVEQQQFRLVQQAGRQRQPLLPAARQRAGELVRAP